MGKRRAAFLYKSKIVQSEDWRIEEVARKLRLQGDWELADRVLQRDLSLSISAPEPTQLALPFEDL